MAKFTSTKTFIGFPCTHRQWRTEGHCKYVHGYSRSFHFEFQCDERTKEGYVMDFSGLKKVRAWLEHMFDHTFLVAEDDPEIGTWKELDRRGLIQMRALPNTCMEGTAQFVHEKVSQMLCEQEGSRVRVSKVEVRENEKNSAFYKP